MKTKIFVGLKIIILTITIFVCSSNACIFEAKVTNNNLNKAVNLSTMAKKVDEFDYDALYSAKDTYTGDLTGYVYNCPACTGRLACMGNLDLSNGTTTYHDATYGNVKIVASSSNLECGTIIRFDSARISSEPVYAIVLDRGVLGNALDLLSADLDEAYTVGRSVITYDVLRNGWNDISYAS